MSSDLLKQLSVGLLAAAASIFNGASLQAQDAKKLEEMIVQGIKYDLLNALEAKRRANSIVEVISSEDIGSFPDNNVADSLARLPGVSITQSFGEGHEVSVRGFGPGQNLTLLNGQTQASSGFGYENEITRSFNYSLLPAEIVSKPRSSSRRKRVFRKVVLAASLMYIRVGHWHRKSRFLSVAN